LKKKTTDAPNAVTNHVKQVASNACKIGFNPANHSYIILAIQNRNLANVSTLAKDSESRTFGISA
jgi:hypothetical protein